MHRGNAAVILITQRARASLPPGAPNRPRHATLAEPDLVPFASLRSPAVVARPARSGRPCSCRRGVTLLEVAVVLVLLGVMAAVVLPPLAAPPRRPATLLDVVRDARSAALARAQSLQLTVAPGGRWLLTPLPSADADTVAAGTLEGAPPLALQLSSLGACVLLSPPPASLGDWDAASCRPVRSTPAVAVPADPTTAVRP